MITSAHAAAKAATAIPGYCTSGHGIVTPAQWSTCAKLGWNQPTTGAVHLGTAVGGAGAGVLMVVAVVVLLLLVAMSRSRKPATQS
jgi:hypothetical protein